MICILKVPLNLHLQFPNYLSLSDHSFVTDVINLFSYPSSRKTTILPVVLCGCETWSLTLREEHTLGVLENRVLRRIFGLKRN
jgi:hypothetical protein